jgi:hypothetical protein
MSLQPISLGAGEDLSILKFQPSNMTVGAMGH